MGKSLRRFSSELSLEIVKAIQAIPSLPYREVQIVKKQQKNNTCHQS